MSKRIYRAVQVNKVDLEQVWQAVEGQRVVLGVDVAKEDFVAAVMDESRRVVVTVKWTAPGETLAAVEFVRRVGERARVEAAMESTGTYGDPLRYQMELAGVPVFRVSAKRCHDAAEVYDGVPSSHDGKSAAIIAQLHSDGRSERWLGRTEEEADLAAAVDRMALFDGQVQQGMNRLEAKLARHFPEVTELLELDSATLLALVARYGGPRQIAADPAGAKELMARVGGHMLAAEKRSEVLRVAGTSTGQPMTKGELEMVKELARETDRARRAASEARRRVEQQGASMEPVCFLRPTIGAVTAAVLVVDAGDLRSFSGPGAYVKALGLNLKERSSGKHKGQLAITKRGPGRARAYLYLAVLRLIQSDAAFRAWYDRKVERDGGKLKLKALVALTRKLAAGLWHVAQGVPFDTSKLFDTRRLGLAA